MPKASPIGFTSTDAKDFIRSGFDLEIIRELRAAHYADRKLAYFGLPGEDLLDILSWREFIGRWTAVQIADTAQDAEIADRLELNVLLNRLEHEFQMVRANIDDLLTTPEGLARLRWPYEIVNLDYYGGLVNYGGPATMPVIGPSRRQKALEELFFRQKGTAFVLFLTLNLRQNDAGELTKLLDDEERDLLDLSFDGVRECFGEHRALKHAGELKIYVPIYLGNIAKWHNLVFRAPILYRGTKQMLHFAITCTPYQGSGTGRIFRVADHVAFINLPLDILDDGSTLRRLDLGQITSRD